ncbi:hypothetical protein TNCV_115131 [Trichonephila clavipes]|nr:hypothetical protein TNCV_115131 [Trichonephila clavipes]
MNETIQLNRRKTTQLVSRNETTRLCDACNRLHHLYSRIGFLIYGRGSSGHRDVHCQSWGWHCPVAGS